MALAKTHIEILTKRGLDPEILVAKGWDTLPRSGTSWLSIPFFKNGETVNHKYRTFGSDKRFHQDKDAVKCLYNFDCLTDETLADQPLIITEGELDAESAILAGFPRTVSVPDGAPSGPTDSFDKFSFMLTDEGKLLPELAGIEKIVLAVDDDPAGRHLYDGLMRYIGAHRCQWIKYPFRNQEKTARYKDLNEVLAKHGTIGVQKTLETAQWHPVDGIFALSELPPKERRAGLNSNFPGLSTHYRLRKGDFCVVTGIPNHGKTQFCINLSYYMARHHNWRCLLALFETEIETEFRNHIIQLHTKTTVNLLTPEELAEAEKFIDDHYRFIIPKPMEDATLDWLRQKIDAGVLRFNADMVLVDPWNELDHIRPANMNMTDYTGMAIKGFKRMAKYFDVHTIICAHPTKEIIMGSKRDKPPIPSLYDIEGCYSDDTEALTSRGWLRHAEITKEDDIACFNPETGGLEWHRPSRIIRRPHNGDMHHYQGYGFDMLVTPDHPMLVMPQPDARRVGSGKGRPEKYPPGEWCKIESQNLSGARWKIPLAATVEDRSLLPHRIDAFWRLAGWFAAEGHLGSTGMTWAQGEGEGADEIDLLFERLGAKPKKHTGEPSNKGGKIRCVRWYIGKRRHPGLFSWYSKYANGRAHEKRIPSVLWELSVATKWAFLEGYLRGDGHYHKQRETWAATTTSKGLANDLQRLAVELGVSTSGIERRSPKKGHRHLWLVYFGRRGRRTVTLMTGRHRTIESYDGLTWCLTVPTGAYFLRRNGRVVAQRNSRHWYGKCDIGIVVHRDFDGDITTIRVAKTRYHDLIGDPGDVDLRFNRTTRDYEEISDQNSAGDNVTPLFGDDPLNAG